MLSLPKIPSGRDPPFQYPERRYSCPARERWHETVRSGVSGAVEGDGHRGDRDGAAEPMAKSVRRKGNRLDQTIDDGMPSNLPVPRVRTMEQDSARRDSSTPLALRPPCRRAVQMWARRRSKRSARIATGTNESGIALVPFPLTGDFFSCSGTDLFDVTFWPFLLVFGFTSFKVIRYAAVDYLVAHFELVFVGITRFSHYGLHSQD